MYGIFLKLIKINISDEFLPKDSDTNNYILKESILAH